MCFLEVPKVPHSVNYVPPSYRDKRFRLRTSVRDAPITKEDLYSHIIDRVDKLKVKQILVVHTGILRSRQLFAVARIANAREAERRQNEKFVGYPKAKRRSYHVRKLAEHKIMVWWERRG